MTEIVISEARLDELLAETRRNQPASGHPDYDAAYSSGHTDGANELHRRIVEEADG